MNWWSWVYPHRVFDGFTLFDIFEDFALVNSMIMLETSSFSLFEECLRAVAADARTSRMLA